MEQHTSCPVAATLNLIGGKYKALILWHLAEEGTCVFPVCAAGSPVPQPKC